MKIAIFSENLLNNNGGAEVYALKLAEALSLKHDVILYTVANKRLNVLDVFKKYNVPEFKCVQIKKNKSSVKIFEIINRFDFQQKLKKNIIKSKFDLYINTSCNRMMGFNPHVESIHLIHFPVQPYSRILKLFVGKLLDRKYRKSYSRFWSNSEFTKGHLANYWKVDSVVLNPPICMELLDEDKLNEKENTIIVVGRLVPDKKIKEMIQSFIKISDLIPCYKLVVIGNKDTNFLNYYEELLALVKQNDKVNILSDVSYQELVTQYKKAKIFWHAKGFGVDDSQPLLMEHFGMTTVEAMANGCVPIVINKAGQKEIVINEKSGFLWDDLEELQEITCNIINNQKSLHEFAKSSIERSSVFIYDAFVNRVNQLV